MDKLQKSRYVIYPIQHNHIWELYQTAQNSRWLAKSIDLTYDISDWETKLKDKERFFIKKQLAFFRGL